MGEWIKSRGINGEWGWININTGEFMTSAPTQGTTYVQKPQIYEKKKMSDLAAERAIKAREERRTNPKYDLEKDKEYTRILMAKNKPSTTELLAGAAADLIDGSMIGASFIPGIGQLTGTAYWGLKGAKNLSLGNYLEGALETLPIAIPAIKQSAQTINKYGNRFYNFQNFNKNSIYGSRNWTDYSGFSTENAQEEFSKQWGKIPNEYKLNFNINSLLPHEFEELKKAFADIGFTPKGVMDIGPFNKKYSELIVDRLEKLGYDTKSSLSYPFREDWNQMINIFPNKFIPNTLTNKPVYVGLEPKNYAGHYHPTYDVATVDPGLATAKGVVSSALHERVLHPTDAILEAYARAGKPEARDMYKNFINKLYTRKIDQTVNPKFPYRWEEDGLGINRVGNTRYLEGVYDREGNLIKILGDDWREGRATIGELIRKYLYKIYESKGKPTDLDLNKLTPEFEKLIDELPEEVLLLDLKNINGYGFEYSHLSKNNPNFTKDLKELIKRGAMYITPIGIGAAALQLNKKGGTIYIKKKNRGKFTSYCGGKVTDKCIKKGKNSSDPKIRKRATFAANARKWKHRFGGLLLKAQEGNKIDYTQLAKIGVNAISQGIATAKLNKAIDLLINALRIKNKADKQLDWLSNYQSAIEQANREAEELLRLFNENLANGLPSSIVTAHNAYEKAKAFSNAGAIDRQTELDITNLLYLKNLNTSDTMSNIIGGLSDWGINYLSNNWKSTKNKAPVSTNYLLNTNFWTTPTVTSTLSTNQFTTNSALNNSNTFWNL